MMLKYCLNEFLTNHSQLNGTPHSLIGFQAIITLEMFTNLQVHPFFHKFISAQQLRSLLPYPLLYSDTTLTIYLNSME